MRGERLWTGGLSIDADVDVDVDVDHGSPSGCQNIEKEEEGGRKEEGKKKYMKQEGIIGGNTL
jgi:hypothetical protein